MGIAKAVSSVLTGSQSVGQSLTSAAASGATQSPEDVADRAGIALVARRKTARRTGCVVHPWACWVHNSASLSLPKAALLETAQQPENLANGPRHRPGREAEHGPTCRPLGIILPPRAAAAEHQPTPSPPSRSDEPDRPSGRREQLQWTVPTDCSPQRQQPVRLPFVHCAGAYSQCVS
jgi:hypothetical protein